MTEGAMTKGGTACCVLFTLHGQLCALPVEPVRDILDRYELTPVPLAPPEITGHLNLRGRVVTAIDLRRRLPRHGTETAQDNTRQRAIVVEEQSHALRLPGRRRARSARTPLRSPRAEPVLARCRLEQLCVLHLPHG